MRSACDAMVAGVLLLGLGTACGSSADGSDGSGTPQGGDTGGDTGGAASTGGATSTGGAANVGGTASAGGGATGTGGSPIDWPPAEGAVGVWENVTPAEVDIEVGYGGMHVMFPDPARPTDVYITCDVQGTYKSTDYGLTWKKTNLGANGEHLDSGRQWYGAMDMDPDRNPDVAPVLYLTQGYGDGGIWKSTDGGVDWANVWDGNIFAPDGVTNISADVGSDIHSVHIVDEKTPDRLIVSLHSYWGDGGNNGVFETTNGGDSWIVHKSSTFNFQPHQDIVFPVGPATWLVTGSDSNGNYAYRTTDGGGTWVRLNGPSGRGMGRQLTKVGNVVYASSDEKLWKSSDLGASWTQLDVGVNAVYTVFTSATRVYISGGPNMWDRSFAIRYAELDDDTSWTDFPIPEDVWFGVGGNEDIGSGVPSAGAIMFDGTHEIMLTSNFKGGAWRYVLPEE